MPHSFSHLPRLWLRWLTAPAVRLPIGRRISTQWFGLDLPQGEGAQPLPPAPQRTSAHHSRTASAPAPPEITRQRSWARSHSGSEPARDPSTGHQRSSSSLEKVCSIACACGPGSGQLTDQSCPMLSHTNVTHRTSFHTAVCASGQQQQQQHWLLGQVQSCQAST